MLGGFLGNLIREKIEKKKSKKLNENIINENIKEEDEKKSQDSSLVIENETVKAEWTEFYEYKYNIGRGGFGCVFEVKDRKTNEYRAAKIINKNEFKNKEFINEVSIMKKCTNNNSVKIYELFDSEKEYAIIMELCDCNLKKYLDENPNGLTTKEIKKILTQLNNTFRIMVDKKIIHRDLKLENILLKYENLDYTVKLTDYGISKKLITYSQKCYSNIGTIETMAPEVLDAKEYNNNCDLWSLGIIIYQLYFKVSPYRGETEVALLKQIKNAKQKFFKKTDDPKLDDLIRKLLIADPSKRLSWKDYFEHPFFK